jgi:hypothetical protein
MKAGAWDRTVTDLRRVFRLDRDPAWAWLPGPTRFLVTSRDLITFLMPGLYFAAFMYRLVLADVGARGEEAEVPVLGVTVAGAALLLGALAVGALALGGLGFLQRRIGRRLVLRHAARLARPIQAWTELDEIPDGTPVSVVGYVKARLSFPDDIGGKPAVGVVVELWVTAEEVEMGRFGWLPSFGRGSGATSKTRQRRAFMEGAFDFDLASEAGETVSVAVPDGHMLVEPTRRAASMVETEKLLARLDTPVGAQGLGGRYGVLHDGDPVEVIGFAHRTPSWSARRGEASGPRSGPSVVLRSSAARPLLIIPLGRG